MAVCQLFRYQTGGSSSGGWMGVLEPEKPGKPPSKALIARFKEQPSLDRLRASLDELSQCSLNRPSPELMDIFSRLLLTIVPTFYTQLDIFVHVFSSPVGLSCLCSILRVQTTNSELAQLLEKVFRQPNIVHDLWTQNAVEARKLIWGSTVLNSAAPFRDLWLGDASQYSEWLSGEMIRSPSTFPSALLDATAKLGNPVSAVAPYLKDTRSFGLLVKSMAELRPSQRRFLLTYGLLAYLSTKPPEATAGILKALAGVLTEEETRELFSACASGSLELQRAVVVFARETGILSQLCDWALRQWSNKTSIKTLAVNKQRAVAQICIGCAINISQSEAQKLLHSSQYIDGVSAHLESPSETVRGFGTTVAQHFAKTAGESLDFGVQDESGWCEEIDHCLSLAQSLEQILAPSTANIPEISASLSSPSSAALSSAPSSEPRPDKDSDDEDDDDIEEEEVVAEPFYIKDLHQYLIDDTAPKVQSALTYGPDLIRRKVAIGFTGEVQSYAPQLLKTVANLTDRYNLPKFAEQRQALLTALLVAVPSQSTTVVELLSTGDWSLSQRVTLMATLALAAQDLAGITEQKAPSAYVGKLPSQQHRAFISSVDKLSLAIQETLVLDSAKEASALPKSLEKRNGKVIRQSASLKAAASKQTGLATRHRNTFAPLAQTFFFPLASIPTSKLAKASSPEYTQVIMAQWLKTLGYLLWCAYPSSHQLVDIAQELAAIVLGMIHRHDHEFIMEESLYTACLYIVEVCPQALNPGQVAELYAWVGSSWQKVGDPATQRLGAALVLKLSDLLKPVQSLWDSFAD